MDGAIPVAFLVSASAQDTKRAIRVYEGLNDKKGEAAGFQQGIRTGNAGNEVSLNNQFCWFLAKRFEASNESLDHCQCFLDAITYSGQGQVSASLINGPWLIDWGCLAV